MRRPGNHDTLKLSLMSPEESGRGVPPLALTVQTRDVPPWFDAKAMVSPSPDHPPVTVNASKNVSCLGCPPVIAIVYTFVVGSWPMLNAIDCPSGEIRGRSMMDVPRASPGATARPSVSRSSFKRLE